jgi:hypothetical protein
MQTSRQARLGGTKITNNSSIWRDPQQNTENTLANYQSLYNSMNNRRLLVLTACLITTSTSTSGEAMLAKKNKFQ